MLSHNRTVRRARQAQYFSQAWILPHRYRCCSSLDESTRCSWRSHRNARRISHLLRRPNLPALSKCGRGPEYEGPEFPVEFGGCLCVRYIVTILVELCDQSFLPRRVPLAFGNVAFGLSKRCNSLARSIPFYSNLLNWCAKRRRRSSQSSNSSHSRATRTRPCTH
jgi:hypothetical protein